MKYTVTIPVVITVEANNMPEAVIHSNTLHGDVWEAVSNMEVRNVSMDQPEVQAPLVESAE